MNIVQIVAKELKLRESQVEATVRLIDDGNTIPFIARYRKEATGSLDDTVLRALDERLSYLRNLQKRKEEVLGSIESQGLLTEEIRQALDDAKTITEVDDIYRPFRPKRKTRASVAKEKGLEPLALLLWAQDDSSRPEDLAVSYLSEEAGILTVEDALQGAKDIIAEMISDQAELRKNLRTFLWANASLKTTSGLTEPGVYSMYYDFSEPVSKLASHRILAIDRGEREDVLKVSLVYPLEDIFNRVEALVLKKSPSPSVAVVQEASHDACTRLILPSIENEIRNQLSEQAAEQAIKVFALNLRPLLLQPPVKGKVALGFDPAYRTGCKIAVVDATGKVLDTTVIYPTPPQKKLAEAEKTLVSLIQKHQVSVIAIGNGTASKESEIFVSDVIRQNRLPVSYMMVSEAGASVYSASKLGAEEFPQFDVSLRSAVSIARRLQDPLAELVKIDPKAIGVGQYQHDMPKAQLDLALRNVVEDCVNSVGVDVNTASISLLSYISGIGPALAKNIVSYREENGHFHNRKELLHVPKLGKKAFEQAAGFLRVAESENPLDRSAVHPESYPAAIALLSLAGLSVQDLGTPALSQVKARIAELGPSAVAEKLGIGVPTLEDILQELLRPGRDPRDSLPPPMLRTDVLTMEDLKPDMVLTGTVRNVVDFGVFVDISVHQDGLVHISQMSDRFLKHPSELVKVGDIVQVKVLEVDLARKRISLTMKGI